ncbi:MAG TPA: hypothetical protein VGK89_02775 [Candidatus Eisenbacteria bacterium]|jgi:hypothetical protein
MLLAAPDSALFDVASRISTPLALAGLIAAVLFLLIRQLLRLNIFRTLTVPATLELLRLIVKSLFQLAVVAMILGFVGFIYVESVRAGLIRSGSTSPSPVDSAGPRGPIGTNKSVAEAEPAGGSGTPTSGSYPGSGPSETGDQGYRPAGPVIRDTTAGDVIMTLELADNDTSWNEGFNQLFKGRWVGSSGWEAIVAHPPLMADSGKTWAWVALLEEATAIPYWRISRHWGPELRAGIGIRARADLSYLRPGDTVIVGGQLVDYWKGPGPPDYRYPYGIVLERVQIIRGP